VAVFGKAKMAAYHSFQFLTNIVNPLAPLRLNQVMLKLYMQVLVKAIQEIQFLMETGCIKQQTVETIGKKSDWIAQKELVKL
jgi:hypothetical protein